MTFLGMPAGRGNLTGDRPFPAAAHDALTDSQLRRGRGDALTWTLGARRARRAPRPATRTRPAPSPAPALGLDRQPRSAHPAQAQPPPRVAGLMSAREEILARIRTALADRPQPGPARRDYRGPAGPGDLERFVEHVTDYRATVHRAGEDVQATITRILTGRGVPRVVVPDGFPDEWRPGISIVLESVDIPALDAVGAVLTTGRIGIAETGTIVPAPLATSNSTGSRASTARASWTLSSRAEFKRAGKNGEDRRTRSPRVPAW